MSTDVARSTTPAARRTLYGLVAALLGVLPLKALFADNAWLVDVTLAVLVVLGPAVLLRLRRPAGALDIWPGVLLLIPWLTARYVGAHAYLGVLPTSATMHDISLLLSDLHRTSSEQVAPVQTTVAIRLVLCALIGLLAALIDLIAVVGRRGALAGVPLLVVFTVAGAVPRKPVHWVWFVGAAAAFLVLLAIDAGDDLTSWGRRVRHGGGARNRTAQLVSAQRIAVAGVVAALVLPLLVPSQARNLIADAFHGGGGSGTGNGGAISPFASLKGQLTRRTRLPLADIHVKTPDAVPPFYLRTNVLSTYTDAGWIVADHGSLERLADTRFPVQPDAGTRSRVAHTATISVTGLSDNVPVFAVPSAVSGVGVDTSWSSQDQILLGSKVSKGLKITESFQQPVPTVAELRAADAAPPETLRALLDVPARLPQFARDTVRRVIGRASTAYDKARAINDYFTDPTNGFAYSLTTKQGDSGSDLVDFLKNKIGYCQQFAAAMGIMLRIAGVPARVVLGYMHPPPNAKGNFTVTTNDAHSWVEAYFPGVGWVPFDPTPVSGLTGGARGDLSWAPHPFPSTNSAQPSGRSSSSAAVRPAQKPVEKSTATAKSAASSSTSISPLAWQLLVVLVLIGAALVPASVRLLRRRRRLHAARRDGDADPLWAELSDTAVDLGYVWSPARSPRQVASWLAGDVRAAAGSLETLAVAVERRRYSPADAGAGPGESAELIHGLRDVTGQLRSRRSTQARIRALLWPASLGWGRLGGGRRR